MQIDAPSNHAVALSCCQSCQYVWLLRGSKSERLRRLGRALGGAGNPRGPHVTRTAGISFDQILILVPLGSKKGSGTILATTGPESLARFSCSPSLAYWALTYPRPMAFFRVGLKPTIVTWPISS